MAGTTRRCRVRCSADSDVIYVNKQEFYECFPKAEIEKLQKESKLVDLDHIVQRICHLNQDKKQTVSLSP